VDDGELEEDVVEGGGGGGLVDGSCQVVVGVGAGGACWVSVGLGGSGVGSGFWLPSMKSHSP